MDQYYMNPTEYADYMDEKYFEKMYPSVCKKMKKRIEEYIETKCKKNPRLMYFYPTRREIEEMVEDLYEELKDKIEDLEEEIEELKEERQIGFGRRGFFRPLLGTLLILSLLGRRRRGRRRPYYGGYDYYGQDFSSYSSPYDYFNY